MATERIKAEALSLLETDAPRLWFRRKFNLPPTDPRYLDMDDERVHLEFYIHQELDRRVEARRKALTSHCKGCGYEGPPHYLSATLCPRCGAEMTRPQEGESDQTVYRDDNFAQTVRDELGIELPDHLRND